MPPRMLRRGAALLAAAVLLGAAGAATAPERLTATARVEPLPPFRMVWVEEDARGDVYAIELMWRGFRSWTTVLRASSADPASVGRTGNWDGVTLTNDEPVRGRETFRPELTVNAPLVPAQWLIPRVYSTDNGWEPLDAGPDGHERFRKTEIRGGKQRTTIRTRDPSSGLIVAVTDTIDGAVVRTVRVTELEVLARPMSYP